MTVSLFDSHSHIQMSQFDDDRDAAIRRARDAGLVGQLVLGTDVASSISAIELATAEPDIYAAAGCHPHDAKDMDKASLDKLAQLAEDPHVAVVGEIGLDFYRNLSPHDVQIDVLNRQLELAGTVSKPVALHGRQAHAALLPFVEAWSRRMGGRLPDGRKLGVMHYFDGDLELGRRYSDLGFFISIHCSVTYPDAGTLAEVAAELPLDVLLVETDSPYGPPQSRRGQRNEPAYVEEAVVKIAQLRNEKIERVAETTTANALRLLGLTDVARPALERAGATEERSAP
ncbi:MAG: TatD family hydrolase [Chloroflexi bacterium]|nr:TatD family hydrolase [Chloroflexota bacterium]MCI0856624.1 TatD family hydrolase [Chloroflexota bacterium]MCI0890617.1 TatD family hydrolase [Chloroflexota bacterium]